MLIHEFKDTHNQIDIETRVYLDMQTKSITCYQYKFKKDKVLDINCINVPMNEFGILTKSALKSYLLLFQKNQV
jgi:hypothetical protein